ncbi:MAG: hypothetical protein JO213_07355 [Alphaproteobacteria bacterium]|nr:hypothetical protein [Alphaproteobacteria bacterium]
MSRMLKVIVRSVLPFVFGCASSLALTTPFIDLSAQVPGTPDVCSAVKVLYDAHRDSEIAAHALTETTPELMADPRGKMTASAWTEATAGGHYNNMGRYPTIWASRVALTKAAPQAWVLSASIGSLHNPVLWVFASTPDGSKPAHVIAKLGEEASGPFDTYFVWEEPYVVTRHGGEKGPYLEVYRLDPGRIICSFSPP